MPDKTWRCCVIKDGGDDPDVTTGLAICSVVKPNNITGEVVFKGREGAGTVTLPGLENRTESRQLILYAIYDYTGDPSLYAGGRWLTAEVSIPGGEMWLPILF